jgi:hypothetical protein
LVPPHDVDDAQPAIAKEDPFAMPRSTVIGTAMVDKAELFIDMLEMSWIRGKDTEDAAHLSISTVIRILETQQWSGFNTDPESSPIRDSYV